MSRAFAGHAVWGEIAPELTPRDFRHPNKMDVGFLAKLSEARRVAGVPFRVVSDHREPGQAGVQGSAHEDDPCKCVDLRCINTWERWKIVTALIGVGFERIGIYPPTEWQKSRFGKGAGSIHVDDATDKPRPRIWTGY